MFDFGIIPTAEASLTTLMKSIDKVLINPVIFFMFAVALAYFLYGLTRYLVSPGNEEVHKKSKSVMLWGIIGLFIMTAVFGIMKIILNTVGENKIKINSNGDIVIDTVKVDENGNLVVGEDSGPLLDRDIPESPKSGLGFNDVTETKDISTIVGAPDLPLSAFTTNPFPLYEKNALCWNDTIPKVATTEYVALNNAKIEARDKYLKANGISPNDQTKKEYPVLYASKVLYNKKTSLYHAWIDVRAPIKGGTLEKNCALKILKPAPTIADSAVVFTKKDLSTDPNTPDLLLATVTVSPFPTYEKNALCWNDAIYAQATNEFDALKSVKAAARAKYLKENNVLATDKTKANYPMVYTSKVLFYKKTSTYYAWVDIRAPKAGGTLDKNCNLKILKDAPEIPSGAVSTFTDKPFSATEISSISGKIDLPLSTFTSSPFPTYEKNSLCWNSTLILGKDASEYEALKKAKGTARAGYLFDTGVDPLDKTKMNYPILYNTIVLYDHANNQYYAWLDARAPIKTGTLTNCKLKILKEAPEIPTSAVIFTTSNGVEATSSAERPDLPIEAYTTSPFPIYAPNDLCWTYQDKGIAVSEYDALAKVRTIVRAEYLKQNNVLATDTAKLNYPVIYTTIVLYNYKTANYYAWLDVRAPKGTGTIADCSASKLVITTEGPDLPPSTLFSKVIATTNEINLSQTVVKNTIKDFTKSPFIQQYETSDFCWRKELYGKATTEFTALAQVKIKARFQYIGDNNLDETKTAQNLPAPYGMLTAFDKVTQNYYVWMDARGPINGGRIADCDLIPTGAVYSLPDKGPASGKKYPLNYDYASDNDYYRAVDSGVDPDYSIARKIALMNALIDIAEEAGAQTLDELGTATILEERYYQKDFWTGNYDYWVALELHK